MTPKVSRKKHKILWHEVLTHHYIAAQWFRGKRREPARGWNERFDLFELPYPEGYKERFIQACQWFKMHHFEVLSLGKGQFFFFTPGIA